MPKLTMALNKIGRTINLATGSYQIPRKPPLNTLIFEKLPEPQCEKLTCGVKAPSLTKPVRICTKEELQSFYCPPPCDCKSKAQPLSVSQRLGKLFGFGFKSLLVGSITYYMYKEGIWGNGFKSSCFLGKIMDWCPPEEDDEKIFSRNEFADMFSVLLEEPEPCMPFIPRSEVMIYNAQKLWNRIVIFIFWFFLDAPMEMIEALLSLFRPRPKKPPVIPDCTS